MMRLLLVVLALSLSGPLAAQEKKAKKPAAAKKAAKKEPAQDWGRFNAGAKKDLDAIDKKKAKK